MKVLLLAGGFGTRLSEETDLKPKPMVEIGGKPILWHIMKLYSQYGFNDFVILCGYKGYYIKEYFVNYFRHQSDMTIDMQENKTEYFNNKAEPWKVTLIDTGLDSMTGGRVKRAQDIVGDEPFMLTYGDGVSDINIEELVKFHKSHGKAMTMTSAQPEGRFGALNIEENFEMKPEFITLVIEGGKKDKLRAGDILGALTGDAGLKGTSIGRIDIYDRQAYVAIESKFINLAEKNLKNGKIKNKKFSVWVL